MKEKLSISIKIKIFIQFISSQRCVNGGRLQVQLQAFLTSALVQNKYWD